MSAPIKDGGPAFPLPVPDDRDCCPRFENGYGGMSLRDYFAAKAMPVLLDTDLALPIEKQNGRAWVAGQAYLMADAMLRAREAVR